METKLRVPFVLCTALIQIVCALRGAENRAATPPDLPGIQSLFSFKDSSDLKAIRAESMRFALAGESGGHAGTGLRLEIEQGGSPALYFSSGNQPWDWRGFGAMALELDNPSDESIGVLVRIDDDPAADGVRHSSTSAALIGPRQTIRLAFPIGSATPMAKGMRGGPPIEGYQPPPFIAMTGLDESHITGFQLRVIRPPASRIFFLRQVQLLPVVSYDRIVDMFGQYTRADWPGKLKDRAEFAARRAAEEAELKAHPVLRGRDEYGGWAEGPQLSGTGYFRTTQRDGKWWLVTPSGHLFLSFGVNSIRPTGAGATVVEGRDEMFTWLPDASDPLVRHLGSVDNVLYGPAKKGRTFNFYTANLERKYGPDYQEKMRFSALKRLRAWGFNTIANWSDPALFEHKRVPYTATVRIEGDFARLASGIDYWGKMADPFDPRFAEAARESLTKGAQAHRNDPWCVGYFVDNEISWGGMDSERAHFGLVFGTLQGNVESPAKRAFLQQLQETYPDIEKLNAAWATRFDSWKTFLGQPVQLQGALSPAATADFSRFLKAFARQYFGAIKESLRKADPNHLYLGCRFAWYTVEAVEAAGEYCDVVSFNAYERRLDPVRWDFVKALNKPCIIGEFHMGAIDRGLFHPGLVSARNQEERAQLYADFVRSVVDHPSFVGCGWFEYADEPLTGRSLDGENYCIGLVSVTDTPYPEMVAASKTIYGEAYQRRAGRAIVSPAGASRRLHERRPPPQVR